MSSFPPSPGVSHLGIVYNQTNEAHLPKTDKQISSLDEGVSSTASLADSANDKKQDPSSVPVVDIDSHLKDTVSSTGTSIGREKEASMTTESREQELDAVNSAASATSSEEKSKSSANEAKVHSTVDSSDDDADYKNAQRAAEKAQSELAEGGPSKLEMAEEKKINEPSERASVSKTEDRAIAPMDKGTTGLATPSGVSSFANTSTKRDSASLETSPSEEPPSKKQKEGAEKAASSGPSSETSSNEMESSETGLPNAPSIDSGKSSPMPGVVSVRPAQPSTEPVPLVQENKVPAPALYPPGKDSEKPVCDPDFASRVNLDAIPEVRPLPMLTPRDVAELELALQIGDKYSHGEENSWREDWSGNLQLLDKELLMNRDQIAQDPSAKPILLPFFEWAMKTSKDSDDVRPMRLLFSYVYHMKGTPPMAQKIMAHSLERPAQTVEERRNHILDCIRRISYDPTVLNQDGWTTAKADAPDGASGGAFLIGRRVVWHKYEAVVIAFVRDEEIGDLWKAMWLEDLDTFDLEADELQDALRKWEKREALKQKKAHKHLLSGGKAQGPGGKRVSSQRFAASSNFTVDGIEHGIILASSFNSNARHGILWPARVMHVSEIKALGSQAASRRSSSKNTVHAVFLAPYWNSQSAYSSKGKSETFNAKAANATNPFCAGPLFEMDMIEVSESTIKKYPYNETQLDSLSIDRLQAEFRFLGLPKAAFARYLDSHRLAMALKSYARREIAKKGSDTSHASAFAALTETHTLSVKTALFPPAVLGLPFEYALSKLPHPTQQASQLVCRDDSDEVTEPVMKLHLILKAMTPPHCWGTVVSEKTVASGDEGDKGTAMILSTPQSGQELTPITSPNPKFSLSMSTTSGENDSNDTSWSLQNFASDYLIRLIGTGLGNVQPLSPLSYLGAQLADLLGRLRRDVASLAGEIDPRQRKELLRACLSHCLMVKGHGEDMLSSADAPKDLNVRTVVLEWRKACERIYKRVTMKFSTKGFGNGVTPVITDSRCNQHITASGSFERAVRLPAAIRGAKKAGAGSKETMPLIYTVDEEYMDLTEKKILPKAHKASYLKRMKNKVAALPADAKGVPLTDDSDGEGGEDTMGSRGSYTAAVAGVAAALKGADMIVSGQCINAFCAVRPPGHHAGRELRPMKAISNGFCLLNAAASAALYATTPRSEGGLGLKRVCVIDFDVHHGNGTQDILCSTHDSRFLYVSLHAGGAHINGYDDEDGSDDGLYRHSLGTGRTEGIFPGRCGDTSPHEGVLNIPLGQKVTAAAIGQALVTQVSPAVESFSPELVILSAGFDAHKHDPLGMGGLSAEDFGSVTEVACQMAYKSCSGRVLSILEGGYGVPCACPPQKDLFLPGNTMVAPPRLLDLNGDLPESMEDIVPPNLAQKLDRCHAEGFMDCVQHHVGSLAKYAISTAK